MTPRTKAWLAVLLVWLFGFCPAVRAQQQGEAKLGYQITALPYTISSPGVYVLNQDFLNLNLTGATAAIKINASDVVLDLNGHTISNTAAGAGTLAYGVYAADRTNVTVRNGTVQGFMTGVGIITTGASTASYGHLIEKMNVNACTYEGISLVGNDSTVRSCQVGNVGGSTTLGDLASAYGIELEGTGLRCLDNDVSQAAASVPVDMSFAIYFSSSSDAFVVDNCVFAFGYGLYFSSDSVGQYRHNLATGMLMQGYVGGTDAGKNIVDSNGDGVDDDWEVKYFGTASVDLMAAAPGCGGITNLEAYHLGLNPNDFYNGQTPALSIVDGDGQTGGFGGFLPSALTVQVLVAGQPAANAPVSFTVTQNGGQVQATMSSAPSTTVKVKTNISGVARTFFILPESLEATCKVVATTGTGNNQQTITFTETVGDENATVHTTACSVSNVISTLNSDGSELLTWNNNTDDPVPLWNTAPGGGWTLITTLPAGTTSYLFPRP